MSLQLEATSPRPNWFTRMLKWPFKKASCFKKRINKSSASENARQSEVSPVMHSSGSSITTSYGLTKMNSLEHVWTVENFSLYCDEAMQQSPCLKSAKFSFSGDQQNQTLFSVWISPRSYRQQGNPDYVSLYIHAESTVAAQVQVWYRLSIVDVNTGQRRNSKGYTNAVEMNFPYGMDEFIRRDQLLDPKNGFISKDDKLTLLCEIKQIVTEELTDSDQKSDPVQVDKSELNDFFANLYEHGGAFVDVSLIVAGQEFGAHKIVLATRSPVFADMFELNMTESHSKRVEIADASVEVFQEVLHHIYTGQVPNHMEQYAVDLLIMADKYQLDQLKSICEEWLGSNIIPGRTDLSVLLRLADIHNAISLKAKVVDYLRKQANLSLEKIFNSPLLAVKANQMLENLSI